MESEGSEVKWGEANEANDHFEVFYSLCRPLKAFLKDTRYFLELLLLTLGASSLKLQNEVFASLDSQSSHNFFIARAQTTRLQSSCKSRNEPCTSL